MKRLLLIAVSVSLMMLMAAPATADNETRQRSDVLAFADLSDHGTSALVRTDKGIRLSVSAIVPSGVYTLWWVVWNNPENCGTPFACRDTDLGNPNVGLDIGWGGADVVGYDGQLNVSSKLTLDSTLGGLPTEFGLPIGNGLVGTRHAEIHFVLRTHGDPIPPIVNNMRKTFNGGCDYAEQGLDGLQPKYGIEGPNSCADVFFGIFPSEDA